MQSLSFSEALRSSQAIGDFPFAVPDLSPSHLMKSHIDGPDSLDW